MSPSVSSRRAELVAAATVLLVYIGASLYMPKDVFWHPDEGAKFLALQTIHWDGGLTYTIPYPGRVMDPGFEFYPGRCRGALVYPMPEPDGGVRFRWPIWFSLASRPFFDVFGVAGVYVLPLLGGWLTAVVAGRWMAIANPGLAPFAILLVGFGTPIFFYSLGFFEHTLATFAGVVAISILIGTRRLSWRTLLQMAPFFAVAVVLRVEMLAFVAALVLTWALSVTVQRIFAPKEDASTMRQPRRRLSYVATAGLIVVALVALATLLAPRQRQLLLGLPDLLGRNLQKGPQIVGGTVRLLMGRLDLGPLRGQLWDLLVFLSIGAAMAAPFLRSTRAETAVLLGALVVLLESSLFIAFVSRPYLGKQGVLGVAPFMIVGGYVLPYAWRQRDEKLLRLAIAATTYAALGYLALFSSRVNEWGNDLIGLDGCARYMLTLYPMGVVLSLVAIQNVRASDRPELVKSAISILVMAMVIVSFVYQFRGLREMRANKQVLVAWEAALRGEDRVVTDVWWLPAVLAPLSTTQEMYCIDEPGALPAWLARAGARGIRSFTFSTTREADAVLFGSNTPGLTRGVGRDVEGLHLYRVQLGGSDDQVRARTLP